MDPDPGLYLLACVVLCLFILALTSAVDAAFTSVSWRRLHAMLAERAAHSRALARLIDEPYRFKAAPILLNTGATIAAAALTLQLTRSLNPWAQTGFLVLLLFAILVISAALPKMLVSRDPQATVLALVGPVSRIAWLLWPLLTLISLLSRPLAALTGSRHMTHNPLVVEEELRILVDAGAEQGLLEPDERERIEGVFSFGDRIAREVMVPRVDVVALNIHTSLDEALDTVLQEGHSRIPVYRETIDTIVGMLYAKDLLHALRNCQHDMSLEFLLRPVHFVPETIKVDALLKDLQHAKIHLAVVIDEYGGTAGLATIEDLLEEIVGEIQDEYDVEEPYIQIVSETELIVDSRTLIDEINAFTEQHNLRLRLESGKADRLGGLVYEHLGRVPRVTDEVVLNEAVITVLSVKGVRLQKLRITCPPVVVEPSPVPVAAAQPLVAAPLMLQPDQEEMMLQAMAETVSTPDVSSSLRRSYATSRLHRTYYRSNSRS